MKSDSGETSLHQQMVEHEACLEFLDTFRRHRDAGETVSLTLLDPEFTGTVVEVNCVEEDGTITGVDGIFE